MRADILSELRCPVSKGSLTLDTTTLAAQTTETFYGQEICEGLLYCAESATHYPIIAGVAILVANPMMYIASNYSHIISQSVPHLSPAMLEYLQSQELELYGSESADSWSILHNRHLILGHYGTTIPEVPRTHPVRKLLDDDAENWYDGLVRLLDGHIAVANNAVDVGCNIGGVTYRLAPHYQRVYGVDLDFNAVLLARSILLGQPTPLESYKLQVEGIIYQDTPLAIERPANVEILLADGFNLPFKEDFFDLATGNNLINVIGDPSGLIASLHGALSDNGLLLLADAYMWGATPPDQWIGGHPGAPSVSAMRTLLCEQYNILADRDQIPQVVWWNERMFATYMTHQILVQKKGA